MQTSSFPQSAFLSVVCPCYNEQEVVGTFYAELKKVLTTAGLEHEIIFVDDGSYDRTLEALNQIAAQDASVKVYSFSRNFGHQIALTAGLDAAKGGVLVMLDSDLQHPPSLIPEMVAKWKEGYEIVSAVRKDTDRASFYKEFTSRTFYRLINLLSDIEIPVGDPHSQHVRVLQ
jgi:glycosyltransferase involved in cell wall biosynthesis